MTAPFEGGCLCGAVRYKCSAEPIFFGHCHCRDCQHASGGAFSSVLAVPKKAFELTKGEYNESGGKVSRKFCPTCGAPLFSELVGNEQIWIIKAATLDDPSWLEPGAHIWTCSSQPWAPMGDELPQFEKDPSVG